MVVGTGCEDSEVGGGAKVGEVGGDACVRGSAYLFSKVDGGELKCGLVGVVGDITYGCCCCC